MPVNLKELKQILYYYRMFIIYIYISNGMFPSYNESILFMIWLSTIGIIYASFKHFDSKPLTDLSFQPEFDRIDL